MSSFLAGKLSTHDFGDAVVFISVSSEVKCNPTDNNKEDVHIGHTQEADMKIIVLVKHCLLNGFRNAVVTTVDTNVITLLLAHLYILDSPYQEHMKQKLTFTLEKIKINDVCSRIIPKQQLTIIFFFTFTGCDITSLFFDVSNSTW